MNSDIASASSDDDAVGGGGGGSGGRLSELQLMQLEQAIVYVNRDFVANKLRANARI